MPALLDSFRPGDRVFATLGEQTVRAVVVLASSNGYSLMLALDGDSMLGGFIGFMPVLFVPERGRFEELVARRAVGLSRVEAAR